MAGEAHYTLIDFAASRSVKRNTMSGGRSKRKKGPSVTSAAAQGLQKFFWKTLLPVTPIALVLYALLFTHNRDITGEYVGSSPVTGAVNLILEQKDGGQVDGVIVLKQIYRMKVIRGQIDDAKINLAFALPGNSQLRPTFSGSHFAGPVSGISLYGNVSQGDFIEGVFYNGSANIPLKLTRNSTTSLFKKYWFRF